MINQNPTLKPMNYQHRQFKELYPELFSTLNDLVTKIDQVCRPAEEIIIDDVELCSQLHVSKRTSATWRAERVIKYSIIKGKIYYIYSDVLAFVKKYSVATLDGSLKIKLRGKEN